MPAASPPLAIDLGQLSPGLGATCGDYLDSYRREHREHIRRGDSGIAVARRYAKSLDGLLSALFCASQAASMASGHRATGRIALVAVGGYGRGLVGLHSDCDVLFLCESKVDTHVENLAGGVLYPLWDLGLSIGHVVRDIDETLRLAREDSRTATTLLDLRRVAGDPSIVTELTSAARRQVFEPHLGSFIDALQKDAEARQERFGGSLFLLEPEIKLGRGGLRDLDIAEWAAKARWAVRGADDMVRTGALLPREVAELEAAREHLWRVRGLLHLRADRRQDRLTFEDQEEIAKELGFRDRATLAVEQFMQTHYRHARIVAQTAERMLDRARPKPAKSGRAPTQDLGDGTLVFDRHMTFKDSDAVTTTPVIALRLYQQVVQRNLPAYPFARDVAARVSVDTAWAAQLRGDPEATKIFLSLLTHVGLAPVRRGSILGELHEVGLMLAMIPEFEAVTGRVQHDIYHVYTVDVHSVAAVDRLLALMRGDLWTELALPSRLASEAPRRIPLMLALLLHDIGKADGRKHSERGAVMARPIAERMGLASIDVEHVVWLVAEHLSLYHWAMRRDTTDPDTIAEIARNVSTIERLRDLYLLTVADLSTTHPNAMTSWKARMLDDLYLAVAEALEGGDLVTRPTRTAEIREQASVGFVGDAGRDALELFLEQMPDRYLLANPVDAIRRHARIARDRGHRPLHVAVGPGSDETTLELVVVTDDRPGLLGDVTAALAANRLAVVSAQIYTRGSGEGAAKEAFDAFLLRRSGSPAIDVSGSPAWLDKVEKDLGALADRTVSAGELLARRQAVPAWANRHEPSVPTEVSVDNSVSARFTVVDVFTKDRIGVLHTIAKTLHGQGLSIALSKVATEGARAIDVFYVTGADGQKIADAHLLSRLSLTLKEQLDRFHAGSDSRRDPAAGATAASVVRPAAGKPLEPARSRDSRRHGERSHTVDEPASGKDEA